MASDLVGDIIHQWGKIGIQFQKTASFVSEVKNTQNLDKLRESAKELQEKVELLNYLLEDIPSTSKSTSKRTRNQSSTKSTESKRKRHKSGVITLEELKNSLNFNPSTVPSVGSLQSCKTAQEKIQLLYSWEVSAARLQIRASFHQGFYLQQLIKENNYTTKDLRSLFPEIPEYNIKRNLQLYNTLGNYRTILFSNLSVSRLWRSISSLKEELNNLSPEDIQYWEIPPINQEVSCFIKCYKEWYGLNPTKNVYYILDIYDNNLSHWTQNGLIEQLAVVVSKLERPEVDELNIEDVPNLHYDKFILWYHMEGQPGAHCAIITRKNDNTWDTTDELLKQDLNKKRLALGCLLLVKMNCNE